MGQGVGLACRVLFGGWLVFGWAAWDFTSLLLWVLGWALGSAAGPGVALYLKPGKCPPKQHECEHLVWKMLSLPSGWRWLKALGCPGPELGACWRQVGSDGLTQAVVGLECPAQRLASCGCSSDMFYGPVSSYSRSCPAPPLPE